ncbi:adenosylcobinamide kinase/adenosylcobinamide phosphate guanyltransferase, partial [Rhodobacteraceae bacterium R_SAG10]|nr:adenosylcobinamide kinase/adenosylcobinamide phosphate guanyltransferase [Rhodobacteraceae bacterium R_SAG10]
MFPKVTLVLGGASSGKSAFAEALVLGAGKRALYLATAQALDAEMAERIARHRARRAAAWRTAEVPLDVAGALGRAAADEVVLLDCATLWLSN